jgi:RhoGEF domain
VLVVLVVLVVCWWARQVFETRRCWFAGLPGAGANPAKISGCCATTVFSDTVSGIFARHPFHHYTRAPLSPLRIQPACATAAARFSLSCSPQSAACLPACKALVSTNATSRLCLSAALNTTADTDAPTLSHSWRPSSSDNSDCIDTQRHQSATMVVVVPPPPTLSPDAISIFYVVDELLARSPVLMFYGPSATPTATSNNSRIQAHIFSPAGLQSYPRLTISPSSPLYAAVNCLPREEQGDEICRGLAFSLYKYFAELPQTVKDVWENMPSAIGRLRSAPILFSEAHAALLASRMVKVENVAEVIQDVRQALAEQTLSWLDVDVVLPAGTMKKLDTTGRDSILPDPSDEDVAIHRYGAYAALVRLFGDAAFLPTSRLRRAPSKSCSLNRSASFRRDAKENVRREMCELLDTEESYVSKLYDLVHSVAEDFRQKAKTKNPSSSSPTADALKGLFPPSLDTILETNSGFLEALRKVVEETENDAIQDIESTTEEGTVMPQVPTRTDVTGALALATTFRAWFPKFAECYVDYIQAHSQFSNFLRIFMRETGSSFSRRLQETGEQRLMSMLIEPVQRLPRYQLYIDNIIKQLPARHPAIKSLLKARDTITDICSQDVTTAKPSQIIEHLRRIVPTFPITFKPSGRLVTAVDIVELPPPYRVDLNHSRATAGILLLFTDFMVILKKQSRMSTNARGLMAQLDGVDVANEKGDELSFRQALELHAFDLTEMDSGRMLQLVPLHDTEQSAVRRPGSATPGSLTGDSLVQIFHLAGQYEGKANKFLEEFVKAKVEGRFSEAERESHKWEVRTASGLDLTLFLALSEQSASDPPDGRGAPAKVKISVGAGKRSSGSNALAEGLDIAASVSIVGEGFYRLDIDGTCDYSAKDHLTAQEFLPVLIKRSKSPVVLAFFPVPLHNYLAGS